MIYKHYLFLLLLFIAVLWRNSISQFYIVILYRNFIMRGDDAACKMNVQTWRPCHFVITGDIASVITGFWQLLDSKHCKMIEFDNLIYKSFIVSL